KEEIFCSDKISRGEVIRKIKSETILVNNQGVKPSYVLKVGDVIVIEPQEKQVAKKGPVPNSKIKIKVISNNDNFLVINKPAGIQVHPDAHEKNRTVVNWLMAKYPKTRDVHDGSREAELRPGIVHRLDKDTSGVMVIAKNQKTFKALKKLFQSRQVRKIYLAIVHGQLEKKAGLIEKPLAKAASYKKQTIASSRTKTKVRSAVTEYRVMNATKDYSLLEVYPKTGRTHQIRVHLTSIGHPIMGDALYKGKGTITASGPLPERHLLHASQLEFSLAGKKYTFRTALPDEFFGYFPMEVKH
ncbi:RluA family pseudouridine synthase, partial [Patescibacteria group bacterium]